MTKSSYFFVIIAAILWGIIGLFVKALSNFGFSPLQIVAIRAIGSSIFLLIFFLFKDRKILIIDIRHSHYFIGTGIASFILFNWFYFYTISISSISIAVILMYTSPVFVVFFSIFLFKEKLNRQKNISLCLTFIGCLLVTVFGQVTGQKTSSIAILTGLASGLTFGLYSIFGRYALEKYNPMTVTTYTFVFASIGILPIVNLKEMFYIFQNINAIYYGVAIVLLCTVLPFLLYNKGLTYMEASRASIISTLEPVVATIIGIAIFNESITLLKVIGILLVVFAVSMLSKSKKTEPSEA